MQTTEDTSLIGKILAQRETKVSNGWIARVLGVSPSTSFRWMTRGVATPAGRIKLASVSCGGRLITTKEAVERFTTAVEAARSPGGSAQAEPPRSPHARSKASADAGRQLEAMGI